MTILNMSPFFGENEPAWATAGKRYVYASIGYDSDADLWQACVDSEPDDETGKIISSQWLQSRDEAIEWLRRQCEKRGFSIA